MFFRSEDANYQIDRVISYILASEEITFQRQQAWGDIVYACERGLASVFFFAYVFSVVEGWRLIDSVWFSYVTMTTIGYGTFVTLATLHLI